jgi:hypothetical protein
MKGTIMPEANDLQPLDLGAIGAILARDLDTIEDLPEFRTPPPGVYEFEIRVAQDTRNTDDQKDIPVMNVTYTITQIIEQNEKEIPEGEQVKPGMKFGETFWFGDPEKTEDTIMYIKARFKGMQQAVGSTDLLEIVKGSHGMLARAIVGNRADKKDKTKFYPTIRDMTPAV